MSSTDIFTWASTLSDLCPSTSITVSCPLSPCHFPFLLQRCRCAWAALGSTEEEVAVLKMDAKGPNKKNEKNRSWEIKLVRRKKKQRRYLQVSRDLLSHPCLSLRVSGCAWTRCSWSCPFCRWGPLCTAHPPLHPWTCLPSWSAAPAGSLLGWTLEWDVQRETQKGGQASQPGLLKQQHRRANRQAINQCTT